MQDLSQMSDEELRALYTQSQQGSILDNPLKNREIARQDREESYDRGDRTFDEAQKLRQEYNGRESVKTYEAALGTYSAALNTEANAQGDQSLITAYAKMLDPNSAVREGEFATTASTENFLNQLKSRLAKELGWEEGGMLTPEGRLKIRSEMRNLVTQRFQPAYERDRQYYTRLAGDFGIDPSVVVSEGIEARFPERLLAPLVPDEPDPQLSGAGATEGAQRIPDEYQQAHLKYLQDNWGNLAPSNYADFRSELDKKYGLTPDPEGYRNAVAGFNEMAYMGGTPEQLGIVPDPAVPLSSTEQAINDFAQTNTGAFLANMGNAFGAGLPARLGGGQDKLEALRDDFGAASTGGEIAGGVTGTLATGGALNGLRLGGRAGEIVSNPLTADLIYGTTYGATQDTENPFRGGVVGAGGAAGGNFLGKYIAGIAPRAFAPFQIRNADNSVPSIDDLKAKASQQYADVEATGVTASPEATADLAASTRAILAKEGRITPKDRLIDSNTPITRALTLIDDFGGEAMTPTQAGKVRGVLGEGRSAMSEGAPDNEQRRLAGLLLDNLDQWAEPTLPGVDQARQTAQRYIQGEQIAAARNLADANTSWFTQSGPENALRNAFRGLDKKEIAGKSWFEPHVAEAIQTVSRGTPTGNAARRVGKLAPTGAIPIGTAAGLGTLTSMSGGPGILAGAVLAGAGTAGRGLATQQTKRAAEVAELMARGGPEYQEALMSALEAAKRRGGLFGGGIFTPFASQQTR